MKPFEFDYYSHSKASKIFELQPATLRYWEKSGILFTVHVQLGTYVTRRYIAPYTDDIAARLGPPAPHHIKGARKGMARVLALEYTSYVEETIEYFCNEFGEIGTHIDGEHYFSAPEVAWITGGHTNEVNKRIQHHTSQKEGERYRKGHIAATTLAEAISFNHLTTTDDSLSQRLQSAR